MIKILFSGLLCCAALPALADARHQAAIDQIQINVFNLQDNSPISLDSIVTGVSGRGFFMVKDNGGTVIEGSDLGLEARADGRDFGGQYARYSAGVGMSGRLAADVEIPGGFASAAAERTVQFNLPAHSIIRTEVELSANHAVFNQGPGMNYGGSIFNFNLGLPGQQDTKIPGYFEPGDATRFVFYYANWSDSVEQVVWSASVYSTATESKSSWRAHADGVAPVPEMENWAMLLGGLGLLATRLRRRD
ncbi:hypothetical protein V8J88_00355 [Massilia sp. W12]|uniref:hypothetical protein n=1 Tax=Massilia sp. W12 TaxID=3126507 RepID=UPI0030D578AE